MVTNPNVARVRAHYRAEAIALQSEEVYLRYMKCLNGCAQLFRDGYADVHQFTLRKTASDSQRPSVFIASPQRWKPPPKSTEAIIGWRRAKSNTALCRNA
jgi:hypothetical protein